MAAKRRNQVLLRLIRGAHSLEQALRFLLIDNKRM
jgi:hypothetical protein